MKRTLSSSVQPSAVAFAIILLRLVAVRGAAYRRSILGVRGRKEQAAACALRSRYPCRLCTVNWPQLLFALALLIIGGVYIASNAVIFWLSVVRKEHAPAVVPIVGGPIAAAGIALLPFPGSWKWAWVPLVVDWGGFPLFVLAWYERRPR